MLSEKIKNVIDETNELECLLKDNNFDAVKRFVLERNIKQIVEDDFMEKNPDEMIDEYSNYFKGKNISKTVIDDKKDYYRARIGYRSELGADDDLDKRFIIPYYDRDIMAPPPLLSTGGRFNREGSSYLYIADDIETCMAEVHLQVGQLCSVGTFKCKSPVEVIDLTAIQNDIEMEIWISILTQPVYKNICNRYNITKFLAEVLRLVNKNGIMFKSSQSKGNNLVCFNPDFFELVPYSERLYKAKSITYESEMVKDSVDEYVNQERYHLSSYNADADERREKVLEYIESWIDYRKSNKLDNE